MPTRQERAVSAEDTAADQAREAAFLADKDNRMTSFVESHPRRAVIRVNPVGEQTINPDSTRANG